MPSHLLICLSERWSMYSSQHLLVHLVLEWGHLYNSSVSLVFSISTFSHSNDFCSGVSIGLLQWGLVFESWCLHLLGLLDRWHLHNTYVFLSLALIDPAEIARCWFDVFSMVFSFMFQ